MKRVDEVVGTLSRVLLFVGGIAMLAMMFHISADAISRTVFNRPIIGTLEIVSRYYMVFCIFLPLAFVQLKHEYLMVEAFTLRLKPRTTALLDGVVAILCIIYAAILTYLVYGHAVSATARREAASVGFYDIPIWAARWVLPVSFGLMCVVILTQAIKDLHFGITGRGHSSRHGLDPQAVGAA